MKQAYMNIEKTIPIEWLTTKQATEFSHICKTKLWALSDWKGGPIMTSKVGPGKKGTRLFNLQSLREFIESGVGNSPKT